MSRPSLSEVMCNKADFPQNFLYIFIKYSNYDKSIYKKTVFVNFI